MTFHPDNLPDLTGKTYIVTGGTAGIGYYTVARLAQHGAHVYLCARSEAKGRKAVDSIQALYANANVSFLVMDHTSLSSVVDAAKLFLSKETALHGLVNNAGVMAVPYSMTQDGYEIHWQVNHLAHWVFTEKLLPLMLETSKALPAGSVRVVNMTSGAHLTALKPGINYADTSLPDQPSIARYSQSKLANVWHARILSKKYGPNSGRSRVNEGEIWTSSIHPGIVESDLDERALEMPFYMRTASYIAQKLGGRWPSDKGAWTSVFAVASPEMKAEQSGVLFERIAKQGWIDTARAKNMELAQELEDYTRKEMEKGGWV